MKTDLQPKQLQPGVIGAPIETQNPSGVSSVDFTTGIDSTFSTYFFKFESIVPATDNVIFRVRVSVDGGSNWDAGASDYAHRQAVLESGGWATTAAALSAGRVMINVGSASEEGGSGNVWVRDPSNSNLNTYFMFHTTYSPADDDSTYLTGTFRRNTAQSSNAVQFSFASGNIESGEISLYGVHS